MTAPLETITIEARGLRFPALACGAGPLVLCLHGFPDTRHSFRHQLRAFAEAGFRAVAPALRGYEPSCLPALSECNVLEVAEDAIAMVSALGEPQAHLVGHDWGAVAAYLAAELAPSTWRSITTLAVPHPLGLLLKIPEVPVQLLRSSYMYFFQLRGVAERALSARDFALIEQLWRIWSPSYTNAQEDLRELKRAFAQPGILPAALAYYRALFDPRHPATRRALSLLGKRIEPPVLALTGAEDGCIDTRLYDLTMDDARFSSVVVERMAGLGHFMQLEDPARISGRIVAWLRDPG